MEEQAQKQKTVFISYRIATSAYMAVAIAQNLRAHGYNVFRDADILGPGKFGEDIEQYIKASAHFLIIIAPGSLKRCENPDDWVRKEFEIAIAEERNIVPLLFGGFKFKNNPVILSGALAELPKYQSISFDYDSFNEKMSRLRTRFLQVPFRGQIGSIPDKYKQVKNENFTPEQLQAEEYRNSGYEKYDQEDYQNAVIDFQLALGKDTLNEENISVCCTLGRIFKARGELKTAIDYYTQAIKLCRQHITNYLKNWDDLENESVREKYRFNVSRLSNIEVAALNNRGNIYLEQGDNNDKALSDYYTAINLNSEYAPTYVNLGVALAGTNRFELAIDYYTQAIRISPNDVNAYLYRGMAYQNIENLDKSLADYDHAIGLNASTYLYRGSINYEKSLYEVALADYTEASRLNPNAEAYYGRGTTYMKLKKFDNAIQDYKDALKSDPDFKDAHIGLGAAYRAKDDFKNAKHHFVQALSGTNSAMAYCDLGEICFAIGEFEEAIRAFEMSQELESNSLFSTAGLAITYYVLKENEKAFDFWNKALKLDPQLNDISNIEQKLQWQGSLIEESRKLLVSFSKK